MNTRSLLVVSLLGATALGALSPTLRAQGDGEAIERLRRDQDEILRKAERLQALMQRLLQRYEREQKPEQVQLLRSGMLHLEQSGILREVASIRDDLAATALTEALRKQKSVVDDLERLLNILLERKSVENLDQELADVAARARTARELEQRQRDLIAERQAAVPDTPSAAEQQLRDALSQLRDAERQEADRNARQAGTRRPFLESALQRVQQLLQQQQQLERGLAEEQQGRAPQSRSRAFDLGDLTQRTRELQSDLRDQQRQQALGEAAAELQRQAAGADAQALQQARERFEALLQDAPKQKGGPEGKARDQEWQSLRERLRQAPSGANEAERQELAQLGATGAELAKRRADAAERDNATNAQTLQQQASALADKLEQGQRQQGQTPAPDAGDPAAAVREAAERLGAAEQQAKAGAGQQAEAEASKAQSALERARAAFARQNPDAQQQASNMAAESASTAQELQNAPSAEQAEQQAAAALQQATEALRDVEAGLEQARAEQRPPTAAAGEQAQTARQRLQQAQQTLQDALQQANQGAAEEMQASAERQQQLNQQAQQAADSLQQAAEQGQLTTAQADAARQALQQARQRMQQAAQKLQQGQQSSASADQQAAAEALQQAMDGMQQNRPLGPEQKEQLQQQAKAQQQLAEDIVKLAEELKKRQNKAAERKADQAAAAARKAQQAMEQGDREETEQRQEETRQRLEEAAEELEEEQDRYQDLRQEELLFKMREELTTFLATQQPITKQTMAAQQAQNGPDGLSRAARRKVNQLGEEEQQLAGKLEMLNGALDEEGNLVYLAVLKANLDDLREVVRRLGGRNPDVGPFTTLLQQDIERRTEELLKALERERKRREQERQQEQQGQQQPKGKNRFNQQRQKLVGLIAELEMLKQLGVDTRIATDNLRTLVEARGDDTIAEAETALIERLSHRHGEITRLFQKIKAGVEETMQQMPQEEDEPGSKGR